MIPLRDTMEARGPVPVTLGLILVSLVLGLTGAFSHLNGWQIVLGMLGIWIFGAYVERRLGPLRYLLIVAVIAVGAGLLIGAVDDRPGRFVANLFPPVLGLGLIHLALAPRSRITCFAPIPFAATFFAVPTSAILVAWVVLEVLLTAA